MFKGRKDLLPVVDVQRAMRSELSLSEYDRLLFDALDAWRADDYQRVETSLQDLVERFPRNLLATKLQHGFLFLAGKQHALLAATHHALKRWNDADEGYGYVLGCHSFALGEMGSLDEAERVGRHAVQLEPDDAWGIHAVSHVFEMRDDNAAGARWLTENREGYLQCNNFRGHVFWHLALFELALGDVDRVFELCDTEVQQAWTGDYRDMSNVASLLWRLEVDGYDVGERWQQLGDIAIQHQHDHGSAFADAHYCLAIGRTQGHAQSLLSSIEPTAGEGQAAVVAGPGQKLCAAISAYSAGDFTTACTEFEAAEPTLTTLGGSNAQRDLFEQLYIEAALAAGDTQRCRKLLASRLSRRPNNPWAKDRLARTAIDPQQ